MSSVLALLLLAIVMGTISVCMVDRLSEDNSEKIMMQLCEQETLRFNSRLNMVYHSVGTIYEYAMELQRLNGEVDVYSTEYQEHIREFSIAVANQTDGAMAVYFRYNPEITGSGTDGFLWTKTVDSDVFREEIPTDILAYNSGDIERVGWFYEPKKTGEPLWMAPYYNKNLDVLMISYIIPVYLEGGEFVGVIGVDIDFKTILKEAQGMQIYESGSVAMVDLKDRLIYYFDDANVICCNKLFNGMMIYINVPNSEINSNRNKLILICILVTVFIFSFTSFVIMRITRRIVYPIERLTEITKQYTEGDWSGQYISDTGDEVQRLSEGVAQMAKKTQEYIEKLNNLARTDALTGIGNRTSYLEQIAYINQNKKDKYNAYAVVAMDLNFLKKTNDTYGHEYGDALIKEAANYISHIFEHSPTFRIGGDEFVAILYGDDFANREQLLKQFSREMYQPLKDISEVQLSISFGMAEYPGEAKDYETVFELADERMYQKKKQMKMGNQDRG